MANAVLVRSYSMRVLVVPSLRVAHVLLPPDFGFITSIFPCLADLGSVLQALTSDEAINLNLYCAVVHLFPLPTSPHSPTRP